MFRNQIVQLGIFDQFTRSILMRLSEFSSCMTDVRDKAKTIQSQLDQNNYIPVFKRLFHVKYNWHITTLTLKRWITARVFRNKGYREILNRVYGLLTPKLGLYTLFFSKFWYFAWTRGEIEGVMVFLLTYIGISLPPLGQTPTNIASNNPRTNYCKFGSERIR